MSFLTPHYVLRVSWFQLVLNWASWRSMEATSLASCFHFPLYMLFMIKVLFLCPELVNSSSSWGVTVLCCVVLTSIWQVASLETVEMSQSTLPTKPNQTKPWLNLMRLAQWDKFHFGGIVPKVPRWRPYYISLELHLQCCYTSTEP